MCQSNYFQNECCSIISRRASDVWTEFGESTVCYSKVIKKKIIKIHKNCAKAIIFKMSVVV